MNLAEIPMPPCPECGTPVRSYSVDRGDYGYWLGHPDTPTATTQQSLVLSTLDQKRAATSVTGHPSWRVERQCRVCIRERLAKHEARKRARPSAHQGG